MYHLKNRLLQGGAFVVAALAWAPLALAQAPASAASATPAAAASTAARSTNIEEVVVTAQKRAQSINDVGLSITAATGQDLVNAGVRDTSDLAKITPGFTFTKSINGTPLYTLRGVGFNDYTLGSTPAVSVYVDEVPLVYSVFTKGAVLDLERVEVLKGPQGILFGQNATGGAVNYIAAKPTEDFKAGADLSYGRFQTFEGSAFVSGPLSDTVSARLAVGATQSGDWQKSVTRADTLGAQDVLRGRLQVEWKPTDRARFLFSANGWRDKSDTQASQLIGLQLQRAVGAGATAVEVNRRIAVLRAYPLAADNARSADWGNNVPLKRDDTFFQLSARADYELTDSITLTSITAYGRYEEYDGLDRDGMSLIDIGVISDGSVKSFTQELRLSGEAGRLTWLVGGNYGKNDVKTAVSPKTADATNTLIVPGFPITTSTTTVTQDIRETAVFANGEYKLTDTLTALVGARHTRTENDFTGCMTGDLNFRTSLTTTSTSLSGTPTPLIQDGECNSLGLDFKPVRTPYPTSLNQENTAWRVGLNYKPARELLIYGTVSKGYKSGSFPVLSASSIRQFKPVVQRSVLAYEAGFKWSLFDRLVQLNGAAFLYEYENKQVRSKSVEPVFGLLEGLVNVPESRIKGVELQLVARPTEGLTASVAATYLKSEVTEFTGINNVGVIANFKGAPLPYTPEWQVTAAVDYTRPLTDAVNGFVGANLLYNSATDATIGAPASGKLTKFTTVDLRAGVSTADDRVRVWIYGRNVFNEYYWTNAFLSQDALVRLAAPPATYGVSLSYKFN